MSLKAESQIKTTGITSEQQFRLAVFGTGSSLLALGMYWLDPGQFKNGPAQWLCPFHSVTGFYCPLCGSTRAVHQLLHLNLVAAIQDNILLVLAVPLLIWAWIGWAKAFAGLQPWRGLTLSSQKINALCVIGLVFAVLRNLPNSPFSWLTPA